MLSQLSDAMPRHVRNGRATITKKEESVNVAVETESN